MNEPILKSPLFGNQMQLDERGTKYDDSVPKHPSAYRGPMFTHRKLDSIIS